VLLKQIALGEGWTKKKHSGTLLVLVEFRLKIHYHESHCVAQCELQFWPVIRAYDIFLRLEVKHALGSPLVTLFTICSQPNGTESLINCSYSIRERLLGSYFQPC
jgi:hypothetical protein